MKNADVTENLKLEESMDEDGGPEVDFEDIFLNDDGVDETNPNKEVVKQENNKENNKDNNQEETKAEDNQEESKAEDNQEESKAETKPEDNKEDSKEVLENAAENKDQGWGAFY